jgi:flagellar basal-body rod protein FlgC
VTFKVSFLKALDISASGLTAQRMRMDIIAENIANIDTTRTAAGGPYRRRVAALAQKQPAFADYLQDAQNATAGNGVVVSQIVTDMSDFKYDYDPTNPDANAEGYVAYPNVDEAQEMIDMMGATRSFEANVTALNATKSMALKALEIGK